MSRKARARPPLGATDNEGGVGGGKERGRGRGGTLVAHVLHLLLPSFTCQWLSQSLQTWKTEVFSLLCHYREIIICCSAFHTDNQDCSGQQNKLPHGGVQKYTNKTFIYNIFPM